MADTAASPTLPSLRELELEELLRKRELQLVDLTTELNALRTQTTEQRKDEWQSEQAVSKASMAVMLPHLVNERNAALGTGPSTGMPNAGLVAALRQRASMLQEENDELYSVLRRAETGRLDEEVKGLRRLVGKLERSLRESNDTVKFLTDELERTTEVVARRPPSRMEDQRPTPSHGAKHRHGSPHGSVASISSNKPNHAPTAPRTHKKPRTHLSPEPNLKPETHNDRNRHPPPRTHSSDARERGPPPQPARNAAMDLDQKRERDRSRSERDRPHREGERERDRDRRVDRDSPRARDDGTNAPVDSNGLQIRGYARSRGQEGRGSPRRGGGAGGSNGRQNGLPNRPDRGLAERMGL